MRISALVLTVVLTACASVPKPQMGQLLILESDEYPEAVVFISPTGAVNPVAIDVCAKDKDCASRVEALENAGRAQVLDLESDSGTRT